MGLDFFRQAVTLQKKYGAGRKVTNTIQTNGMLLDDSWCAFFAKHDFLVGISIDGPAPLHDIYRVGHKEQPTFKRAMYGIQTMKKHGVCFNTLTVLHNLNSNHPQEIYQFLKDIGDGFMQFIPLVERQPSLQEKPWDLSGVYHPNPTQPWKRV